MNYSNNEIDYTGAKALVFLHVIDSIKSEGILYVGNNLDIAYEEGNLLGLKDFTIERGSFYGWYDNAIGLTSECKAYLEKQLTEDKYDIQYFIHYAVYQGNIYQGNKCIMQVFDGICIGIDKSIKIPEWLLRECERNKIWISFSDEVK